MPFPSYKFPSPNAPLVNVLVMLVAADISPPWTPALKASPDHPRPSGLPLASYWMLNALMALVATLVVTVCKPVAMVFPMTPLKVSVFTLLKIPFDAPKIPVVSSLPSTIFPAKPPKRPWGWS